MKAPMSTPSTDPSRQLSLLVEKLNSTHEALQGRAARSVDLALVVRNWLFGRYLAHHEHASSDRSKTYGKALIDQVSTQLSALGIKGVAPTNLRQCRSFFQSYADIHQTLSDESSLADQIEALWSRFTLGWSHYVVLVTIDDPRERSFYEIEAAQNSWGGRELKRQLASSLYERLALGKNQADIQVMAKSGQVVTQPKDVIKDPYVLEFLDLPQPHGYSEHELETAIISRIESFLLELGKGFLFEARQKRFTFDDDHFYVDLVFYNRLLKCYVLIDLKRDKLTHQDLGQMQMYVNYFDRHVKTTDESPTIGIVLCHRKNDALVELTLPDNANIYAAKYQLYLPSKDELRAQIQASLDQQDNNT
jgi:predicted nuclease of restriction endonuclease-like (RecB) superfamily